ncbi:DUF87 domain-containing protein [Planctomycetales bacterium ZRK34]|nr:DUF87 domain-containing protein [Planctomycetales bacterium ZRK34]
MTDAIYADILKRHGFICIGHFHHRLRLSIWWSTETNLQLIVLTVGSMTLLKSDKAYYLKSITEQGETWARDIGPLQDYLEAHFPELRLSFSYFRDITPALAKAQAGRKQSVEAPTIQPPSAERIAALQRQLAAKHQGLQSAADLMSFDSGNSGLLSSYGQQQIRTLKRETECIQQQIAADQEKLNLMENLQREYELNGSAAALTFSISSNLQTATSPAEFQDALNSVVKELKDIHRFQVTQKLNGGRLNIHVAEANEPILTWIEQWLGGALSPRQLDRLGPQFKLIKDETEARTMITPNLDIRVNGAIKDTKKQLAGWAVATLVRRLDRTSTGRLDLDKLIDTDMPIQMGLLINGDQITTQPVVLPLAKFHHAYLSGITGSGKSYAARVLIEETAQYDELNILVLDPRNQSVGLTLPEDRENILSQYASFGIKSKAAKGYDFNYYAPALGIRLQLPDDLARLARGRHIVSFKGMDDRARCLAFSQILDAVFEADAHEESQGLRTLIVADEVQRFTKKRVADEAKSAADNAERALDRTVREGRKYGQCLVLISQSIKDFSYQSAAIRQNINTHVFLRSADREVDYAADFIGDGRQIIQLETATALIHNAEWGVIKTRIRPPLSKVWEYSPEQTRQIVGGTVQSTAKISNDAERLLAAVQRHHQTTGAGLNLSQAAAAVGMTSKRAIQQAVDELEQCHLIRTRKLSQRGQPRIIEPIQSEPMD